MTCQIIDNRKPADPRPTIGSFPIGQWFTTHAGDLFQKTSSDFLICQKTGDRIRITEREAATLVTPVNVTITIDSNA